MKQIDFIILHTTWHLHVLVFTKGYNFENVLQCTRCLVHNGIILIGDKNRIPRYKSKQSRSIEKRQGCNIFPARILFFRAISWTENGYFCGYPPLSSRHLPRSRSRGAYNQGVNSRYLSVCCGTTPFFAGCNDLFVRPTRDFKWKCPLSSGDNSSCLEYIAPIARGR